MTSLRRPPPAVLAWSASFAAYLLLSVYLLVGRDLLPIDALARLTSAHLVFHGAEAKLATIGFVWPPLPTLVLLPVALVPFLTETFVAVGVVSAAAAATAVVLVRRLVRRLGVPPRWAWAVALAFGLNPLVVLFAANGYSEALVLAFALLALDALVEFGLGDGDGALVRAGLWLGLLPLIRYETAVLVLVLTAALAAEVALRARRRAVDGIVQGRLLAFAGLAVYPTLLWLLFSWQIVGDPLYSIRNERSAISIAAAQLGDREWGLVGAAGVTGELWATVFPLGVLAAVACVAFAVRCRSPLLLGLALAPLALPASHAVLVARDESVPLVRYFILAVPAGIVCAVLALAAAGAFSSGAGRARAAAAALVALVLASDVSTVVVLERSSYQTVEALSWQALTTRERVRYPELEHALRIGELVPALVRREPGTAILIDEYGAGFAVVLGSHRAGLFLDHTSPVYEEAVERPWAAADYVLVPRERPREALNEINLAHPGLWPGWATWAERVPGLPETTSGWRLYRITGPPAA